MRPDEEEPIYDSDFGDDEENDKGPGYVNERHNTSSIMTYSRNRRGEKSLSPK